MFLTRADNSKFGFAFAGGMFDRRSRRHAKRLKGDLDRGSGCFGRFQVDEFLRVADKHHRAS
jgi:hypothetical protein